jgi:hypothetical protein
MSTRAVVTVNTPLGAGDGESVQLYHHQDGNPGGMVPNFREAFMAFQVDAAEGLIARLEYAASYIVAAHPSGYTIECPARRHGDTAYEYVIDVEQRGTWRLRIYRMTGSGRRGRPIYDGDLMRLDPEAL